MICESCGTPLIEYVHIRTINGGLFLCKPCLAEINGKNPQLKTIREECANIAKAYGEELIAEGNVIMGYPSSVAFEIEHRIRNENS